MTFKEFIKKIKAIDDVYINGCLPYGLYTGIEDKSKNFISFYWSTGGTTGGSCWSEGSHEYRSYSGDPEPEFDALNNILEAVCPNMKFLQYKSLCSKIIQFTTAEDRDYYGNISNYGIKFCYLEDLYNILCEKNLL